jgi:hypothetical protein
MWFAEPGAALDEDSAAESQDDDGFSNNSEDSAAESQDDDGFLSIGEDSAAESQDGDSQSLAEELHDGPADGRSYLSTSKLNRVENVNDRFEAIAQYIESSDVKGILLDEAPADEEFGHSVSQAVLSNPHFTTIVFWPDDYVAMRDLIPWVSCHGTTLVHLRSLVKVDITGAERFSMHDWNFLLTLLRTSESLQELEIFLFGRNKREDAVMSAIARYLGGSSLTKFKYINTYLRRVSMTGAAFASLCDGIAESSLRELTLPFDVAHVETAAEFLSRAIVQSSLEHVDVTSQMLSALIRTAPVRDLNFAFSENNEGYLIINRKWKPLLSANVPLGLWPHILKRAHASPEASHGKAGILFFLLKEKCDLVPRNTP